MNEIWRMLRDPRLSTTLVLGMAVIVGFVAIALGYRGAAPLLHVGFQVHYLVSGAVAGLALIGVGLSLLSIHVGRTEAAAERKAVAELQRDVLRLLARSTERRQP